MVYFSIDKSKGKKGNTVETNVNNRKKHMHAFGEFSKLYLLSLDVEWILRLGSPLDRADICICCSQLSNIQCDWSHHQ